MQEGLCAQRHPRRPCVPCCLRMLSEGPGPHRAACRLPSPTMPVFHGEPCHSLMPKACDQSHHRPGDPGVVSSWSGRSVHILLPLRPPSETWAQGP